MSIATLVPGVDHAQIVHVLTDRVAVRLVEAIERDELERATAGDGGTSGRSLLATDARRQQLLVGAWLKRRSRSSTRTACAG